MSETTAMVLVAAITALGSVITALIGWLARKGVTFLDEKTKVLDEASEVQRKEAIKNKIVDTVTLVARATMQAYVDEERVPRWTWAPTSRRTTRTSSLPAPRSARQAGGAGSTRPSASV
jgi:hypothetical protein